MCSEEKLPETPSLENLDELPLSEALFRIALTKSKFNVTELQELSKHRIAIRKENFVNPDELKINIFRQVELVLKAYYYSGNEEKKDFYLDKLFAKSREEERIIDYLRVKLKMVTPVSIIPEIVKEVPKNKKIKKYFLENSENIPKFVGLNDWDKEDIEKMFE